MPRLPTYDVPQVELRPIPSARQESIASPALFDAGAQDIVETGQSELRGGTLLNNAAIQMQERENADALFRAETAIRDEYLQYEKSVRERRGQLAWGATDDTAEWWRKTQDKHAAEMGNDMQRKLLDHSVTKMRLSSLESVSSFEAAERRRSLEESARASITSAINLAASIAPDEKVQGQQFMSQNPTHGELTGEPAKTKGADGEEVTTPGVGVTGKANPATGKLAGIKQDILDRIQVISKLNGWSTERREAEETVHLTNFHSQVIQAKLERDPQDAQQYFDLNKEEINAETRLHLEKHLEEGKLRQQAQEATDAISAMQMPLDEAIAHVKKNYSGHLEDEIIRRLKEMQADNDHAQSRDQKEAADQAWKIIVSGPQTTRGMIPVTTWNRMQGEEQRQVIDYLDMRRRRAEAEAKEKEVKDDLEVLDQVDTLIERGDITERSQLLKYEPYLSRSTIKGLYTKLDKRGEINPTEMRRTFEDRLGKPRSKWSDAEKQQWLAYQDYILKNVKESKRPEDLESWADQWFMKGHSTDDPWYQIGSQTYGEMVTKGRKGIYIEPPEQAVDGVNQTMSVLESNGVKIPANKHAQAMFYTNYTLPAERWLNAHQVPSTPLMVASYALLKQAGKPITPQTMDMVARQMMPGRPDPGLAPQAPGAPASPSGSPSSPSAPVRPDLQPGAPMPAKPTGAGEKPGANGAGAPPAGVTPGGNVAGTPQVPTATELAVPPRPAQKPAGGPEKPGAPAGAPAPKQTQQGGQMQAPSLVDQIPGQQFVKPKPGELERPGQPVPTKVEPTIQKIVMDSDAELSGGKETKSSLGVLSDWAGGLAPEKQKALGKDLRGTQGIKDPAKRHQKQLDILRKHGAPEDQIDELKRFWSK